MVLDAVVEGIRGIPIYVFMFYFFFALPGLSRGLSLTPFMAAAGSLITYGTAWLSEVVRGVLEAVPREQRDAAHAVHFGRWDSFRLVIFPQTLPVLIPRLSNHSIDMLKGSALMGFIGYRELTFWANLVRAQTVAPFAPYMLALAIYFGIAITFSLFFRTLEALTPTARVERLVAAQNSQRYRPGVVKWNRLSWLSPSKQLARREGRTAP